MKKAKIILISVFVGTITYFSLNAITVHDAGEGYVWVSQSGRNSADGKVILDTPTPTGGRKISCSPSQETCWSISGRYLNVYGLTGGSSGTYSNTDDDNFQTEAAN